MGQQLMEKPWLKQYGPGVPATIDPDSHPSLVSLLESAFSTHARKDMMAYGLGFIIYWLALRRAGIRDALTGFGLLAERH